MTKAHRKEKKEVLFCEKELNVTYIPDGQWWGLVYNS